MKPPVISGTLALLNVVAWNPLFIAELFKVGNICAFAEVAVMEDHHLLIFGKQDIELDQIWFVESCLDALEGVFGEKTGVPAVRDD